MEERSESGPGGPGTTREELRRLEQRIVALERENERRARAVRRSRMLVLLGAVLYVFLLYWQLTRLV